MVCAVSRITLPAFLPKDCPSFEPRRLSVTKTVESNSSRKSEELSSSCGSCSEMSINFNINFVIFHTALSLEQVWKFPSNCLISGLRFSSGLISQFDLLQFTVFAFSLHSPLSIGCVHLYRRATSQSRPTMDFPELSATSTLTSETVTPGASSRTS